MIPVRGGPEVSDDFLGVECGNEVSLERRVIASSSSIERKRSSGIYRTKTSIYVNTSSKSSISSSIYNNNRENIWDKRESDIGATLLWEFRVHLSLSITHISYFATVKYVYSCHFHFSKI